MEDKLPPKDGGPAFPTKKSYRRIDGCIIPSDGFCPGMYLLDHFAGMAMQSLMSHKQSEDCAHMADHYYNVAKRSYRIAQAMITVRENIGIG